MYLMDIGANLARWPFWLVEMIAILAAFHFFGGSGLVVAFLLVIFANVMIDLITRHRRDNVPLEQMEERLDEAANLREILATKRPRDETP